jgi:hypothetical protein
VHEFFSFLAGGKKSDITPRSIVDGFREFLSKSSYEEFVSGLRGWWRFLRQVLEPQPSLQPQVQWRRAQRLLEDYILRQNRALLRAAESAAAALELIAAAEGKEAATRAAVSASHVVKKFVELYSRCCQVYGVRDEQPLCRLVLGTPDDTNEEATPVLNEAADESTSEQPSSSDDSTLVFDNVPNQAQNHRAVVCRAVVSAISDWVQMARWATQHLGISLTGDLMPEELRFGEELVDILSYDASRDPAEVRWAYATHVLRLLAAPAVRRLARYGGASEPVIMDAMREVLAEQGKIDWSSDTVTRFDV